MSSRRGLERPGGLDRSERAALEADLEARGSACAFGDLVRHWHLGDAGDRRAVRGEEGEGHEVSIGELRSAISVEQRRAPASIDWRPGSPRLALRWTLDALKPPASPGMRTPTRSRRPPAIMHRSLQRGFP